LDLSSGVSLLNPASCSLIFKSSYSLLRSPLRLLQLTFDSFLTMYVRRRDNLNAMTSASYALQPG
jgi:hypothetical protein